MSQILTAAIASAALLAGLALLVGLVLRHHIGGFLRTVEREAQERRDLEARDGVDGDRPE